MLILGNTSTKVQLITGSAGTIRASYSYVDDLTTGPTFTPGGAIDVSITTATTTDVIAAPAANTQRNVKGIIVSNVDASVSNACTLQMTDGTTVQVLWKGTLLVGERIIFNEIGSVDYYAATGALKTVSAVDLNAYALAVSGVVVALCVANGVTDDTAAIAAAIAKLPVNGGTVLLPVGVIVCNNLSLPQNVTLRGVNSAGFAPPNNGTMLLQTGTAPILTITGTSESVRSYFSTCEYIYFYGNGAANTMINVKWASYVRFDRCAFDNTSASWVFLYDVYDSRFTDCDFMYGGSADGTTYPGINLYSEGGVNATNEIFFILCRWESFIGTAVATTGANTYSIVFNVCKWESNLTGEVSPFMNLSSATDITIVNGIMTSVINSGALTSLILATNVNSLKIDLTMAVLGSGQTIVQYVKTITCQQQDINLRIEYGSATPSYGYFVNWDGNQPATFRCTAQCPTLPNVPPYSWYFGTQLSVPDTSNTSIFQGDNTTMNVPAFCSLFGIFGPGTFTTLTLALAAVSKGQRIRFYTTQTVLSLTITAAVGNVNFAPTALVQGGAFELLFDGSNWWQTLGSTVPALTQTVQSTDTLTIAAGTTLIQASNLTVLGTLNAYGDLAVL